MRTIVSEEVEEGAAGHELHDDHDGLLLHADADESDNVWMVVLLEDASFLQKLFLLLLRQRRLTRLDRHGNVVSLQLGLVDVAKVASANLLQELDVIVVQLPLFSEDRTL